MFFGSIPYVLSSMSAKTGLAPRYIEDVAVETKVIFGTITSSPSATPKACWDIKRASDPEPTATAYFTFIFLANSFSNRATLGPEISHLEATTSAADLASWPSNQGLARAILNFLFFCLIVIFGY